MFVTLLFISGLDQPAKVYKLGWLNVCYQISVGHEILVTSSLSHRLYSALIEVKLTHPSLFTTCTNTAVIPSPNMFLFVRES